MTIAEKLIRAKEDYDSVYEAGYNKGVSEAPQGDSYYDEFWDSLQDYGNRTFTTPASFAQWPDACFKPKYTVLLKGNAQGMFNEAKFSDYEYLKKIDTSQATRLDYVFNRCVNVTHLGVIDASLATSVIQLFYGCTNLETIDELMLSESGNHNFSLIFTNANKLQNIKISGKIGNDFQIGSPVLSAESIQSVIDALLDLTGSTAKTITFNTAVVSKLTEAQLLQITNKNWNVG